MEDRKYSCLYCSKVFLRPHGFKTEPEAFHINGCNIKHIENEIKKNLGVYDKFVLLDRLEYISQISSFGAKKGNKYYDRMLICDKLIKQIEENK